MIQNGSLHDATAWLPAQSLRVYNVMLAILRQLILRVNANPQVAAAVVDRQKGPTQGVLYLPRKGIIVEAAKGLGCKINGEPVRLKEGQVHE